MRTTTFKPVGGRVERQTSEVPVWDEPDENGQIVASVQNSSDFAITLYLIPAGCTIPVHAGPYYTLCQIVAGRGTLTLPGGEGLHFAGPEVFMFEAGALHGWNDIVEDTLLTVCEVKHLE